MNTATISRIASPTGLPAFPTRLVRIWPFLRGFLPKFGRGGTIFLFHPALLLVALPVVAWWVIIRYAAFIYGWILYLGWVGIVAAWWLTICASLYTVRTIARYIDYRRNVS